MHRFILVWLVISSSVVARDLAVWSNQSPEFVAGQSLRAALLRESYAALDRRQEAYESLTTADDVRVWNQQRRDFFLQQLGEFPERTPLNAQIVSTLPGDGYRIENVLFESQPDHHVTGNLYLPATPGPYPVVLVPCGHSYTGKAAEGYQRVSILLAKNGIAAFCYDPIGQGERYQAFAPDGTPLAADYQANPNSLRQLNPIPGQPQFNPVEEHTLVGIGSILVGRNTATYRIFDGMRCIDYLVSRPDIIASRIGCTGNSGGGTLTAYLMALDDRIYCAAPGCYLTTFRRLLETKGPQDAEQNIFGQIAFGMDEADYVLMRAPRPTCLLAGTRDATFDITGTWDIFREGKRAYARFDLSERMDMVESDAPHGFTVQLRVGAVRWMRRWMLDRHEPIVEHDFPIREPSELQCTPRGQVMFLPNERSVFDLNRAVAATKLQQRQSVVAKNSPDELRQLIRRTAGVGSTEQIALLSATKVGQVDRDGYRIEKQVLSGDGQVLIPAISFVPVNATRETVLYIHGSGKSVDAATGGAIEVLVRRGHRVLSVDLPGLGETSDLSGRVPPKRHWSEPLFGPDGESFWLSYLLGRSLVGVRTDATLSLIRFLQTESATGKSESKLQIIATGSAGLPALHAAALEPEAVSSLKLRKTLSSWQQIVDAPLGHQHLCETIHGVLGLYDLPDLVRLAGPQKVTTEQPVAPK
ncbi:MAG: acetylxylan esterase [Rhodopirellula sp.]|nr:acetylxylan esterase [Rhodopirellula sp.]